MKLMGLDRLILQQEDAERDDVLAAPVGNIAVDRDRAVALHAAELGIALGVQQLVRLETLDAGRLGFRGLFGQIVFLGHLLADGGKLADMSCSNSFSSVRGFDALRGFAALRFSISALHCAITSAADFRSALTSRFFRS